MSWADHAIAALADGRHAVIRPRGHSMRPHIRSGDEVELAPIGDPAALGRGDIVLVRVSGRVVLHMVDRTEGGRLLIANARGHANGWVGRNAPYGRAIRVGSRALGVPATTRS